VGAALLPATNLMANCLGEVGEAEVGWGVLSAAIVDSTLDSPEFASIGSDADAAIACCNNSMVAGHNDLPESLVLRLQPHLRQGAEDRKDLQSQAAAGFLTVKKECASESEDRDLERTQQHNEPWQGRAGGQGPEEGHGRGKLLHLEEQQADQEEKEEQHEHRTRKQQQPGQQREEQRKGHQQPQMQTIEQQNQLDRQEREGQHKQEQRQAQLQQLMQEQEEGQKEQEQRLRELRKQEQQLLGKVKQQVQELELEEAWAAADVSKARGVMDEIYRMSIGEASWERLGAVGCSSSSGDGSRSKGSGDDITSCCSGGAHGSNYKKVTTVLGGCTAAGGQGGEAAGAHTCEVDAAAAGGGRGGTADAPEEWASIKAAGSSSSEGRLSQVSSGTLGSLGDSGNSDVEDEEDDAVTYDALVEGGDWHGDLKIAASTAGAYVMESIDSRGCAAPGGVGTTAAAAAGEDENDDGIGPADVAFGASSKEKWCKGAIGSTDDELHAQANIEEVEERYGGSSCYQVTASAQESCSSEVTSTVPHPSNSADSSLACLGCSGFASGCGSDLPCIAAEQHCKKTVCKSSYACGGVSSGRTEQGCHHIRPWPVSEMQGVDAMEGGFERQQAASSSMGRSTSQHVLTKYAASGSCSVVPYEVAGYALADAVYVAPQSPRARRRYCTTSSSSSSSMCGSEDEAGAVSTNRRTAVVPVAVSADSTGVVGLPTVSKQSVMDNSRDDSIISGAEKDNSTNNGMNSRPKERGFARGRPNSSSSSSSRSGTYKVIRLSAHAASSSQQLLLGQSGQTTKQQQQQQGLQSHQGRSHLQQQQLLSQLKQRVSEKQKHQPQWQNPLQQAQQVQGGQYPTKQLQEQQEELHQQPEEGEKEQEQVTTEAKTAGNGAASGPSCSSLSPDKGATSSKTKGGRKVAFALDGDACLKELSTEMAAGCGHSNGSSRAEDNKPLSMASGQATLGDQQRQARRETAPQLSKQQQRQHKPLNQQQQQRCCNQQEQRSWPQQQPQQEQQADQEQQQRKVQPHGHQQHSDHAEAVQSRECPDTREALHNEGPSSKCSKILATGSSRRQVFFAAREDASLKSLGSLAAKTQRPLGTGNQHFGSLHTIGGLAMGRSAAGGIRGAAEGDANASAADPLPADDGKNGAAVAAVAAARDSAEGPRTGPAVLCIMAASPQMASTCKSSSSSTVSSACQPVLVEGNEDSASQTATKRNSFSRILKLPGGGSEAGSALIRGTHGEQHISKGASSTLASSASARISAMPASPSASSGAAGSDGCPAAYLITAIPSQKCDSASGSASFAEAFRAGSVTEQSISSRRSSRIFRRGASARERQGSNHGAFAGGEEAGVALKQ
jgi:chemotaxis protein histidine kinase CheA